MNTANGARDESMRRFASREDGDILDVIGRLVRRRENEGVAPVEVRWVKGHAEQTLPKAMLDKHHSRNSEADKATKIDEPVDPVISLQVGPGLQLTYEPHEHENNDWAEHAITRRLRHHVAHTAALVTTLEDQELKNKTRYGDAKVTGQPVRPQGAGRPTT